MRPPMPPRLDRENISPRSLKAWATRRANGTDRLKDTYATRRAAGLCELCRRPSGGFNQCAACRAHRNAERREDRDTCPGCGGLKVRKCPLCKACTDAAHRETIACRECGQT